MAKVLGRVTGAVDVPRGPDVLHRVNVPSAWLDEGARIELELPRNLSCATCGGGGCDRCGRSGAITMRGRREPPEILEVELPSRPASEEPPSSGKRGVVVRIPEKGGMPEEGSSLPRGVLMLSVLVAAEPDPGVRRVAAAPVVVAAPPSTRPAAPRVRRYSKTVVVATVIVIIWILLLILLRVLGYA